MHDWKQLLQKYRELIRHRTTYICGYRPVFTSEDEVKLSEVEDILLERLEKEEKE